jgi:hypothetical protein
MGRCPKHLNVDNFDSLANSLGIYLTDDGASAIGEICEHLAIQILKSAGAGNQVEALEFNTIIKAASSLGIKLEVDAQKKTVGKASV